MLTAGCTSSSTAGTTAPSATTGAPVTSPSSGGTNGGTTLDQGAGGQLVFTPTTVTVNRGSSITVNNVSSIPHTFTVSGQSIDVTNPGGTSDAVTIDLPAGTYAFICRFHVSSGMKGTLVVT
jgi:plastocyanin